MKAEADRAAVGAGPATVARRGHTGACDKAGAFHRAPYAADYVFLQKGGVRSRAVVKCSMRAIQQR
jgi:hypothetical protein